MGDLVLKHIDKSIQHRTMKFDTGQDRYRPSDTILKFFEIECIDSDGELPNTFAGWFYCNVDVLHRFEGLLTDVVGVTLKITILRKVFFFKYTRVLPRD